MCPSQLTSEERLASLEQEVSRLKTLLSLLMPPQDGLMKQVAAAIRSGDKARVKELNELNKVRMGL